MALGPWRYLSPSQPREMDCSQPALQPLGTRSPEILTPGRRVRLEGAGTPEPPLSNPPPPIQARERPLTVQAQSCSERRFIKRTTEGELACPPFGEQDEAPADRAAGQGSPVASVWGGL